MPGTAAKTRYFVHIDLENSDEQDSWCQQLILAENLFHECSSEPKTLKSKVRSSGTKSIEESNYQDYRLSRITVYPLDINKSQDTMKSESVPLKAKYMGYGVVRLYKEYEDPNSQGQETVEVESDDTTVAIVAIPTYFSPTDILGFIGEAVLKNVSHIRMVRSETVNRFMVLLKFRASENARSFQDKFNGESFNSMESEVCHVIFVKSVIFKPLNRPSTQTGIPYLMEDPFTLQVKKSTNDKSKGLGSLVIKELPTCPVCLERMDSDISGLLTISCQHTFHCNCLSRWQDDSCPVCRYSNLSLDSVKEIENQHCSSCGGCQNLWVCLICGNVGCGRYDSKHAIEHYESTNHCFAMDLSSQRVWDYAGDNYVHRLLQNQEDGKLVELPASSTSCSSSSLYKDKSLEHTLEYSDVLLSQLESQREYYESRLAEASALSNEIKKQKDEMETRLAKIEGLFSGLENKVSNELTNRADKMDKLKKLAQTFEQKWKEEQSLSQGLLANLERLKIENRELVEQKQDLESQNKDLMFYLETQEKFKDATDEVKNGTILIQGQPPTRSTRKGKKGK